MGVTRARCRLWVLESNTCISGPVRRLFDQTATKLLPHRYPSPILEILTEQDIEVCPKLLLNYQLDYLLRSLGFGAS